MTRKTSCGILLAVLCLAGCDSGGSSEPKQESEHASSPAAALVRQFYDAANESDGTKACGLLTDAGVDRTRFGVYLGSGEGVQDFEHLAAMVAQANLPGTRTYDRSALAGSAYREYVAESDDGFDVDAVVKGRTAGTYSVVRRHGRLLIDGFSPEEG